VLENPQYSIPPSLQSGRLFELAIHKSEIFKSGPVDTAALIHGLLEFVAFVAMVALHEFAHAWTACRCGDDTPRAQGRLTLDPLAHIDWLGTILLPLIVTVMGAMGGRPMLFGWGRPVQVVRENFRHPRRDDILVSVAGPAMNLLIAIALLGVMKVMDLAGGGAHVDTVLNLARLSLFLCFFNLLPIPPLDGGHIMRNAVGMSNEAYAMLSRYSFLFLVLIMRSPEVGALVTLVTDSALSFLAWPFGWRLSFS
jgi:Zn-dependent protease